MSTQVAVPAVAGAAVCWGLAPHSFELRSSDRRVLDRAAVVFRPWMSSVRVDAAQKWTIVPVSDEDGCWSLLTEGAEPRQVPADPSAAVRRVEYLAVQAIFDGPPDVLTVHAALVARRGRGVLIAGVPEAGKSTLACALWQHGFSLLGDDVAIVDLERMTASPAPRRVSLRRPSRALLGDDLWTRIEHAPASDPTDEGYVFHPHEIDGASLASVELNAIVFLGRANAGTMTTVIRPLAGARAALALLPCANLARRVDPGTLIARFAPCLTAVPAYDLRRAPLDEMVAAVRGIIGS